MTGKRNPDGPARAGQPDVSETPVSRSGEEQSTERAETTEQTPQAHAPDENAERFDAG